MLLPLTACLTAFSHSQAVPTATASPSDLMPSRSLPLIDGTFDYALNASEIIQTGYGGVGNTYESTNLSGDVVYTSASVKAPFSAVYAGGVLISNESTQSTEPFQSLSLSQGLTTRGWSFSASDAVSYLPSSPTVGLSGIPGTGDLGSQPIFTGDSPAQNVLTTNSSRVSNSLAGGVSRRLDATTSISGSGSYGILRFLGGYGLDSSQALGTVSLNHQFDARDSGSISANSSVYSFPGSYSFTSRVINAGFSRRLTRTLTTSASWSGIVLLCSVQSSTNPDRLIPLVARDAAGPRDER